MSITSAAAKGVLEYIASESANDLLVFRRTQQPILSMLYESSAGISDFSLYRALEQSIFNEAKDSVKRLQSGSEKYTDHACVHPQHIAYAIQHDALNRSELKVLKRHLDHQKTLAGFCEHYKSEKAVESLKQKLLTAPEKPSETPDVDCDPHPCCC